jgi:hypothetical protein
MYSLVDTTLIPRNRHPPPPIPLHWDSYTRGLLVSKDRRHLFVTPLRLVLKLYEANLFNQVCTYGYRDINAPQPKYFKSHMAKMNF